MEARIEEPDISDSYIPSDKNGKNTGPMHFGNIIDQQLMDDDSEDLDDDVVEIWNIICLPDIFA